MKGKFKKLPKRLTFVNSIKKTPHVRKQFYRPEAEKPAFVDHTLHSNLVKEFTKLGMEDRVYYVGGVLRDHLLNRKNKDVDMMLEKVSPSDIKKLDAKYEMTGKDFPVYRFNVKDSFGKLNEIELAVARKERSVGKGHNDFKVEFGEDISLRDDMIRRDLTFNSMAASLVKPTEIIDLFNGRKDLNNGVVRHTSDAFAEDPLRVFRAARFAARYGFKIHESTSKLMRKIAPDTRRLSPERVYGEVNSMFSSAKKPSTFFKELAKTNNLKHWFPEVDNMINIAQPEKYHGKNDVFDHTMETLDNVKLFSDNNDALFGALFHDVGKTLTPKSMLPKHHGHDKAGLSLVGKITKRLKLTNANKKTINDAISFHMTVPKVTEMKHSKVLRMVKTLTSNNTLDNVISIAQADRMRDGGIDAATIERIRLAEQVNKMNLPSTIQAKLKGKTGPIIANIVEQWRIEEFKKLLS